LGRESLRTDDVLGRWARRVLLIMRTRREVAIAALERLRTLYLR